MVGTSGMAGWRAADITIRSLSPEHRNAPAINLEGCNMKLFTRSALLGAAGLALLALPAYAQRPYATSMGGLANGSFHDPFCAKPGIRLSRKHWRLGGKRAVVRLLEETSP